MSHEKRFLLIDADSHNWFPNLALMKISAWLKQTHRGCVVDLHHGIPDAAPLSTPDKTYVSCIFFQNRERVRDYVSQFRQEDIEVGGSGWDLASWLPFEVEHIMPDYDLYGIDYSMGFTSRGCIRACPWCDVPRKEGSMMAHSNILEFLHPDHKKVVLLDNNFLASPNWRPTLQLLIRDGVAVNFCQGLDIRLVTPEVASLLAEVRWYNWTFSRRGLHFAFDLPVHEHAVREGLAVLSDAGIRPYRCMFYVLVGYNTTREQDMSRVMTLKELGAKPFVMIYNQNPDPELKRLARWVNGRFHEFVPFEEYQGGRD